MSDLTVSVIIVVAVIVIVEIVSARRAAAAARRRGDVLADLLNSSADMARRELVHQVTAAHGSHEQSLKEIVETFQLQESVRVENDVKRLRCP